MQFCSIKDVHVCATIIIIHLQCFFIFPNWKSLPIKHYLPITDTPSYNQPPFYFLSKFDDSKYHV